MAKKQEIVKQQQQPIRDEDLPTILERSRERLSSALAGAIDTDQFIQVALSTYRSQKALAEADTLSFLKAIMQAAQLGLSVDPMLGEAYLIKRWDKHANCNVVKMEIGYKGMLARIQRSPKIDTIQADVVYQNDEFEVVKGCPDYSIRHKPYLNGDPGDVIASYCVARFATGSYLFKVCTLREIHKARDMSESYKKKYGPWIDHFEAMALKTAVRRIEPFLPKDPVMSSMLQAETMIDAGVMPATVTQQPQQKSLDDLVTSRGSDQG